MTDNLGSAQWLRRRPPGGDLWPITSWGPWKKLIGAPSRLDGGLLRGGMTRDNPGCGGPGSEVVSNIDVQN